MPRIQFSDVVPPEKRSIRNISIPSNSRRKLKSSSAKPTEEVYEEPIIIKETTLAKEPQKYYYEKLDYMPENKKGKKKIIYGGIALLAVLTFVFVMMTSFASANVLVRPKKEMVSTTMKITATSLETSSTTKYEVLKIEKQKSMEVEATEEKMVEKKASGKIMVYNAYSDKPQRLISRTRFETKEGLIFRTAESIVIPGKKGEIPGSIEIEVYADEPGEKYNVDKKDFSIPGFKNDKERYVGFYARSTTKLSGGFIGKLKKVAEETKTKILNDIEAQLKTEVETEAKNQIPSSLVFLNNSIEYQFEELDQIDSGNKAEIGKKVIAKVMLFDKNSLEKTILNFHKDKLTDWENIDTTISNFTNITITEKSNSGYDTEPTDVYIEGMVEIKAKIDEKSIVYALTNTERKRVSEILQKFKGVEGVRASIKPVWKKSFPNDPNRIHIDIE